jgi:hypothetical protein
MFGYDFDTAVLNAAAMFADVSTIADTLPPTLVTAASTIAAVMLIVAPAGAGGGNG